MKDNKIIAEFMGGQRVLPNEDVYNMPTHNNLCYGVNELQYHTSWDWLMPVVDKIESLRNGYGDAYRFSIDMCNVDIENTKINITGTRNKIKATYQAVVQFINVTKTN